jgi:MFS family permease
VWLTLLGFVLINLLISGYTLWLPSLLHAMGSMSVMTIGILSGLPFLAGMAGIFVVTQHSDRHGQERRWHAAIPSMLTGLLLVAAMLVPSSAMVLQIALLVVVGFPMKMFLPLIFTQLTEILPKSKSVTAVVIVSTTANFVGGFGGPYLIGALRSAFGGFAVPFAVLGVCGFVGGLLLAALRPPRSQSAVAEPAR